MIKLMILGRGLCPGISLDPKGNHMYPYKKENRSAATDIQKTMKCDKRDSNWSDVAKECQ